MAISSKKALKNLLKEYRIYPLKGFGQNFLIDGLALEKIVKAANLNPQDQVLEIGPGTGLLTLKMAKKAKKVIAIEKDLRMVKISEKTLREFKNVKIIHGDILKITPKPYTLYPKSYKLVANLPYYIAVLVIRKFLEISHPPKEMILTIQKEVAQRICAHPPKMNLLAVSVQFYASPKIISFIPKKSFWPQPKVDGAILRISRICTNLPRINTNLFFKIVKAGFSQPRKQLLNNLSRGLKLDKEKVKSWLLKNNISPERRAETLDIKDWLGIASSFDF